MKFTQGQISVLASFVDPDRFSTGISNRELHIHDISSHIGKLPAGINDKIVGRAMELGGTCTGEHGVGIGKRKFMELEHGGSYELMNRDKIFF
ncbi:MAG: hypothetical protein M0P74_17640 [Syntrophales bacterium]|jgi:hypothetical protein|nr:hypothetical protein [Syntrophales bacterium]